MATNRTDFFKSIIPQTITEVDELDYIDNDGYILCGKCHTRKQCGITMPDFFGTQNLRLVGIACKCQQEKYKTEQQEIEKRQFEYKIDTLRRDGITDTAYFNHTFTHDDKRNLKATETCKKYVDNWDIILKDNIGILFYGGVGTGKSFLACCIANALLEKLVPVSVTNFPRILNRLQGNIEERQVFIDKLQRYKLLVIDDLGVERDTSYSAEQVFNIIDSRSRAGMPLIITTNMTVEDLKKPQTQAHARIYDRVLEMCPVRIKLTGESRRMINTTERINKAKKILELE